MEVLDIVKKLISNNNYYNELYDISKIEKISDYPIITKKDVLLNYDKIFNINNKENIIYTQTSGSTGIPLSIPWNYGEYLNSLMSLWKHRRIHGISLIDMFLTCHANVDINVNDNEKQVVISKNFISLSKNNLSSSMFDNYVNYIDIFRPIWIYAQPSFVYQLGIYIKNNVPKLLQQFRYIELVGELLTDEIKNEIKNLFPQATVISMYGMQEFNGIMYENKNGMEVLHDNVYVEILRDDESPCDYNEEGNIIVTGLKNSVFPLVRYRTEDKGKKITLNGNTFYNITSGKSNDSFLHNGCMYDGSFFFNTINHYNKLGKGFVSRFQVILKDDIFNIKIYSFDKLPNEKLIINDFRYILKEKQGIEIDLKFLSQMILMILLWDQINKNIL